MKPPTYLYRNILEIEAGAGSMNSTEMSNIHNKHIEFHFCINFENICRTSQTICEIS